MSADDTRENLTESPASGSSPSTGGATAQVGAAGSGAGLSEEARVRAQTEELSQSVRGAVATQLSGASGVVPKEVPGGRTGGADRNAHPGTRNATVEEMTGTTDRIGDVSIDVPRGGTATRGAAQGGGLSGEAAEPGGPGAADPGAGSALIDDESTAGPAGATAESALGDSPTAGRLQDFDAAFNRRSTDGS
jgi:hypothetical protein